MRIAYCDNDPTKLQEHVIKLMRKRIKSDEQSQLSNDKLLDNDFKEIFITKVDRINETLHNVTVVFEKLSKNKCE